ncbi:MAG: hypothetical protein V4672_11600 [Verrucomicrobiota bacterium]
MNFSSVDVVALSRAVLAAAAASVVVACTAPQASSVPDAEVFQLSEAQMRARFPKVQNIGVVELSGAKIKSRPASSGAADLEYLASGGAMLVKKVESPIFAQAPEILVTPEAAILRGSQAMVKHNGRLITSEGDSTKITIDGTQVKVDGPHIIRDLASGKTTLMGGATAPVAAPPQQTPAVATVTKPAPKPVEKPVVRPAPPAAVKPSVPAVAAVSKPVAAKPKPRPAPAPKVVAKPAAKPAPQVDRKELLNLMRAPSE